MATGKSCWNSGGKKMSVAFLGNGWLPAGAEGSMKCICASRRGYGVKKRYFSS